MSLARDVILSWVLCAAADAAHAQVTLFGAIDVAVTRQQGGGVPAQWRVDNGGLGASTLGFRMHEPLRPRLALSAVLEHGFAADTGQAADPARVSFDRQAWIGLETPYGEFRMGRQTSPQHELMTQFDVFGVHPFGSVLANTSEHPQRFDNLVSWRSPQWRRMRWHVAFAPGELPAPADYGKNRYVVGVEYARGPWHATAITVQQNSADTRLKTKTAFAGVSRALGNGRIHAAVLRSDAIGADLDLSIEGRYHTIWSLSLEQAWAGRWTFGALVGAVLVTDGSEDRAHQVSLMARYQLSRRTSLYGVAARLANRRGARFALGSPAPVTAGAVSGLQVGMRHLF
jgi:predicted porin